MVKQEGPFRTFLLPRGQVNGNVKKTSSNVSIMYDACFFSSISSWVGELTQKADSNGHFTVWSTPTSLGRANAIFADEGAD